MSLSAVSIPENPLLSNLPSPCFVLAEELLQQNLAIFERLQQSAPIEVMLALKGFALFPCFPWLRSGLGGASASSLWEARLAAEEFGKEVHVYAPTYRPDDLPAIIPLASHITFNSLGQWHRYGELLRNTTVKAGLRINPEYSPVQTDLYNPCVPGSR
ncbi:carboxynorspermidine decarboxylase, partial [Synechocystis sp. LEGE 06083]|nr:carboxynorspermidine decarboxylase [Synechocystis sp. LEGE 06083]